MKKFSKINETVHIEENVTISIDIHVSKRECDLMLQSILDQYPEKTVLKAYGYEKAIQKIFTDYFSRNSWDISDLITQNLDYDEEWIEQLFLDDLSIDPDEMNRVMKKINGV